CATTHAGNPKKQRTPRTQTHTRKSGQEIKTRINYPPTKNRKPTHNTTKNKAPIKDYITKTM
ncbi:hypothetical protein JS569_27380, partial [Klebsiella pneumoniae]|uniref:hypothetical protein n=1 Tax=Klebsiella pneumoniae TaxID=573 RepID=UPI001952099F